MFAEPRDWFWRRSEGIELIRGVCKTALNPIATPTVVVRTAAQKAVGGYRSDLPHSADLEMWLRLAARGAVAWIDAPQAVHRPHEHNMSRAFGDDVTIDYFQRRDAFLAFFSASKDVLPDAVLLERMVQRTLAEQAFRTAVAQLFRGQPDSALEYSIDLR